MAILLQLIFNALINASIFSLLAVGFGLVVRSLHFFYIAFGALYIIASYALISAMQMFGNCFLFSILLGLAAAIITGIILDRLIYLPLNKIGASSGILLVASLAVYGLIVNIISLLFSNEVRIISRGLEPSFTMGMIVLTRIQIVQFTIGWLIILCFWLFIRNNTFMKGIWAMGETPELIIALGLPYEKMRLVVFAFSSFFAGAASLLVSMDVGVDPQTGMRALLIGAVAVTIGGLKNFWGWVTGAVLLALLQGVTVWLFSTKWTDLITFGILIAILLFRPQGMFSSKKRKEEE